MKSTFFLIVSIIFLFGLKPNESIQNLNYVDCDLLPSVRTNTSVNFHMSEIDSSEYKPEAFNELYKLTLFSNSDSIEKIYNEDYPEIFKKTGKGYKFKSKGGTEIIVVNNLEQEKLYSKYEFKAKFKNYVMILMTYFEGSEVIIVNLEKGEAFTTIGKPNFITETIIYSYADYYGDSDIHIHNIESGESILLSFQNMSIIDSYNISNHINFKAMCLNSREEKYFQILN